MRIIAHLDMDAFFASIEEADSPIFKGKPIVVGSNPHSLLSKIGKGDGRGRGVVSTANYKAREYGIHSALPISIAWQLSQKAKMQGKNEVIFLPVNFERYNEVSAGILEIIKSNIKLNKLNEKILVEPASIDEFYFDLSFVSSLRGARKQRSNPETTRLFRPRLQSGLAMTDKDNVWKRATDICDKIKKDIKEKYKITCSIGLAENKLIAKISAGIKKPDGFMIVEEKDSEKFLEPLLIREIPGIGPKTGKKLNNLGIKIVKDLKKYSQIELYELLGKWGSDLYFKIKGIDDSEIHGSREAKSIGEHQTFDCDTLNAVQVGDAFSKMCDSVFERFKQSGFASFKTVGVTVRFSDFKTYTSSKTLKKPTSSEKEFELETMKLFLPYFDIRKNPNKKLIRLIGVKLEKLEKQLEIW